MNKKFDSIIFFKTFWNRLILIADHWHILDIFAMSRGVYNLEMNICGSRKKFVQYFDEKII